MKKAFSDFAAKFLEKIEKMLKNYVTAITLFARYKDKIIKRYIGTKIKVYYVMKEYV